VLLSVAKNCTGSLSSTRTAASTVSGALPCSIVTETCFAGCSFASAWLRAISRRLGDTPGLSAGRLARMFAVSKCLLPETLTAPSLNASTRSTITPRASCGGSTTRRNACPSSFSRASSAAAAA
jgi:hypothetical protein